MATTPKKPATTATASEREAREALARGESLPAGWSFNPQRNPPLWKSAGKEPEEAAPAAMAPAEETASDATD